ncbi:addiction module protein [Anatilimnocola sp. NA78]|uniref:addiction module protein n=1 Tax=Anatilimnocola sp. NA78 TaxID=3415683 RepID=UPI003CE58EE4
MKDLGIDKLSVADRLALANEIWESIGDMPGIWDEEELAAELQRRDKELEEHPERALTLEQLRARLDGRV